MSKNPRRVLIYFSKSHRLVTIFKKRGNMIITRKKVQSDLQLLLILIFTLLVIGSLFIYSSSSIYALERFGSSHYYFRKHLFGLFLGSIAFFVARWIPISCIKPMSPFFFLGSLLLTMLTLIPSLGQTIHGSSRWLRLGGFSFQPSELLKISLLLYLAYFLSKKEYAMHSLIHGYLPFLLILGITGVVLLQQPDFGLTITLSTSAFIMLIVTHIRFTYIITTCISIIPLIGWLIYAYPYRLKRILTFINPWDDPQGAGFQIIQSLIAIGSGSFWGTGVSHSKQKFFYLPMQHTDFIFSIIAEETGFFGASFLVMIFLGILYTGLRITWRLKDPFCMLVTFGFIILINLQAMINISVALGLLPTKGIGLPFVSYGNSSLIVNCAMLGLIINCVQESDI